MTIPVTKRLAVIAAHNNQCVLTGTSEDLEVDHIEPRSKGGSDDFDNLIPLWGPLNRKKSDNNLTPIAIEILKAVARNKKMDCIRFYEQGAHLKRTMPRNNPAELDLELFSGNVADSYTWDKKHILAVAKAYKEKSLEKIYKIARLIGKTIASVRAKLVSLRIYNPEHLKVV